MNLIPTPSFMHTLSLFTLFLVGETMPKGAKGSQEEIERNDSSDNSGFYRTTTISKTGFRETLQTSFSLKNATHCLIKRKTKPCGFQNALDNAYFSLTCLKLMHVT
jgi:hypothetical protein